jgi:hypothetical protein
MGSTEIESPEIKDPVCMGCGIFNPYRRVSENGIRFNSRLHGQKRNLQVIGYTKSDHAVEQPQKKNEDLFCAQYHDFFYCFLLSVTQHNAKFLSLQLFICHAF